MDPGTQKKLKFYACSVTLAVVGQQPNLHPRKKGLPLEQFSQAA